MGETGLKIVDQSKTSYSLEGKRAHQHDHKSLLTEIDLISSCAEYLRSKCICAKSVIGANKIENAFAIQFPQLQTD